MDPVYCSEGLSTKVLLLKEKQLGWALGVGGGEKLKNQWNQIWKKEELCQEINECKFMPMW